MIETGLNGKTVIVTGANHGIGAAIAIAFAREGARVLITFRNYRLNGYERKLTYLWASLKTRSYEKFERKLENTTSNINRIITDINSNNI